MEFATFTDIISQIKVKENRTDEEIFVLICDFIRDVEKHGKDRGSSWVKLAEYLNDEGFEIFEKEKL